ncbi:MAG: hypothetical protein LC799_08105 [Actinobacteria bacterium]|nr:hypothetical protein [Actinomycetota bacterium]
MKWMTKTTSKAARSTRLSTLLSALTVLGLLVFMASPALAHHKADHTQGPEAQDHGQNDAGAVSDHDGDADSSSDTTYTEENDTNDSTTTPTADEGDNAHPSGKDRSVESGGSGTQGKSESNPDDSKGPMRYEGALGDDKANGPGGTDLDDQDGNNGCGNDDDFDDDRVDTAEPVDRDDDVLGVIIRNATPNVAAAPAAVKGAVLPFTGGAILGYVFAALGLMAAGTVALRIKK